MQSCCGFYCSLLAIASFLLQDILALVAKTAIIPYSAYYYVYFARLYEGERGCSLACSALRWLYVIAFFS
jgi:hypothetical protein